MFIILFQYVTKDWLFAFAPYAQNLAADCIISRRGM
jgi:hypothetical protein